MDRSWRWCWGGLLGPMVLSLACTTLPSIALSPAGPRDPQLLEGCLSHFPEEPFSVFYKVELRRGGDVIECHGLALVEPPAGELKALWMAESRRPLLYGTIRGADVTIAQAAAPFDDPALAAEVLSSLSLAFLPPREEVLLAGRAEDGSPRCRFAGAERLVDITSRQHADAALGFTLREHDATSHELRREVLSDRGDPALGVTAIRIRGRGGLELQLLVWALERHLERIEELPLPADEDMPPLDLLNLRNPADPPAG